MNIGYAITSSYCTINKALLALKDLVSENYNVIPIVQPNILKTDTRFGEGEKIKKAIEKITGNEIISSIVAAEKFGPTNPLDALIIAPATGNTIAKLANGITDSPTCMAAKATLRNNSPVIIAISTNDGLGLNGINIMKLLNTKNIYFVPFFQDDPLKKPNSLIANFDLINQTLINSINNKQTQPLLDKKHLKK